MSKSNISEPFLLATYTSKLRGKNLPRKPGVYATVSRKSNSDDQVTVAVQADGVHILDVSSLHAVISHTMGPATSFACPPLTLRATSSCVSTTYAVIAASSELSSSEESGRVLWVWQDDDSLRVKEKQKPKKSKSVLPPKQTAHTLFSCTELPGRLVLLSTTGEVSLIDADSLEVKSTSTTSSSASVIQAFLLSSSQCSFLTAQNGAVLVVASSGPLKTTQLRLWVIDEEDSILDKGGYTIPVEAEQICSISCSPSGCVTILTVDGSWYSYQLSASVEPEPASPPPQISPPLAFAGLTFFPTPNSSAPPDRFSVSTLALTSSHVLVAGISSLSQEIVFLLWDLQFSVLLASHTLPMPSALSSSLYFQLVLGPQTLTKTRTQVSGQALLIISSLPPSPPAGKDKDNASTESTSMLFVVPYTVPSTSTISAALGLGGASEKWFRRLDEESPPVKPTAVEAKLLSIIRSAVEGGQGQAATAAFMKWVSKDGGGESLDIDTDPKPVDPSPSPRLEYNFVKELLNIVLLLQIQPKSSLTAANASSAYSREIMGHLLEKQVVCSAMIEAPGGLLGALRARSDWNSIALAFSVVLDLKESEIIETLQFIISQHGPSSDDAMQIDTPWSSSSNTAIISLPTFLNLSITYPTSRSPLISAVRTQLRDPDDLTILLEILDKWLVQRTAMEEKLFPAKKDLKKTEYGVWTVDGTTIEKGMQKKLEEAPPLDTIIGFIQVILDASFLSLLQHKKAHQVLQHINTQLNPEIAFANMVESLRGPLEPFAIAQEKAIKESMVPEKEKEKERQKIDWRQRKKRFDGDIGMYQLEELVL